MKTLCNDAVQGEYNFSETNRGEDIDQVDYSIDTLKILLESKGYTVRSPKTIANAKRDLRNLLEKQIWHGWWHGLSP